MVFPGGGPFPRHPSQLYEAALEGLLLLIILWLLIRAGALKRPGLVLGAFAFGYGLTRSFCELYREPDPQLGFLWGGLTGRSCCRSRSCSPASPSSGTRCAARSRAPAMTPLEREIRRIIATDGPIPIAHYMGLALSHPVHGYYATRDPFGARGDFVTARRSARCSAS